MKEKESRAGEEGEEQGMAMTSWAVRSHPTQLSPSVYLLSILNYISEDERLVIASADTRVRGSAWN